MFRKITSLAGFAGVLALFAAPAFAGQLQQEGGRLVVVDHGVRATEALLEGIDESDILRLEPGTAPLAQIARALRARPGTQSVHLLSHGTAGRIDLGALALDQDSLDAHVHELRELGDMLGTDGNFLVYACDVAAGAEGQAFVSSLGRAMGVSVAASTNTTGHRQLGGDWKLEYSTGPTTQAPLLSATAMENYRDTLSHFRGGSITWQSKDLDGDGIRNDVEVTVKTAWGSFDSGVVLQSTPAVTFTSAGAEEYVYVDGTNASDADYTLKTSVFTAKNLDPDTSYLVRFSSSARIGGLLNNANGTWNIQTNILLRDGNLAPKVDLPIIFQVPQKQSDGSTLTDFEFSLRSTDPNADKLRYRLATSAELGNGTNPAGLSINPNTGLITWTDSGTRTAGLYSAGFVAEDVDESGKPKSKTHVDLILELTPKSQTDFTVDSNVPKTRNIRVAKGDSFSFTIGGNAIDTQSLGSVQGALSKDTTELDPNVDTYTFTPGAVGASSGPDLDPGSYPITFEVRDSTDINSTNYLVLTFIVPDPDAPHIDNIEGDNVTYVGTAPVLVDAGVDAVVSDVNTTDFAGGMLKFNVTFVDGQYEKLAFASVGDGPGEIRIDGSDLYYEGVQFGAISSTLNGVGTALQVDFTAATSQAALQALVRSMTYEDTFPLRPIGDRAVSLHVRDPEGHSASYDFFVHVEPHPNAGDFNDTPVEAANRITLIEGDALALSNENISYADPESDPITFTVNSVDNGHFAYVSSQSTPITNFTQHEINLGLIAFVHNGSEDAPSYEIFASDDHGNNTVASAGTVTFTNVSDQSPVLTNSPALTATEATAYSYVPAFTDADANDSHVFSVTNLPAWANFDTATGSLNGIPGPGDIGTHSDINVTIIDNGGNNDRVGVFTITVAAATDTDGDGVPDYQEDIDGTDPADGDDVADTDGDGVPDYNEQIDGTDAADSDAFKDTDGDGVPDHVEVHVDGTDPADGRDFADGDGDSIPDYLDSSIDEDGDGIPDVIEGIADSDMDGVPDFLDTDSDNDGVPDHLEIPGLDEDADNDGIADRFDIDATAGRDANGDGIDDDVTLPDSDSDGFADHADADQDGDGIPDAIESGAYGHDSDNDGIDDRWDADTSGNTDSNGDGIADDAQLVDSDGDGIPDLRDTDSDNDGISDRAESGAHGSDTDGDGVDDAFDVDSTGGTDANGDGVDDATTSQDSDGDGIADYLDLDSDNDSITDVVEAGLEDANEDGLLDDTGVGTSTPRDTDKDGTPDFRDTDSDNDGVNDIESTLNAALDKDGDGRIDYHGDDIDGDGIADAIDGEAGQRGSRTDNDDDGVPVSIDQDDDGDGIPDVFESDGDTDGDGVIDRLDRDSDNDGIPDSTEAGLPAAVGVDSDLDGIDDAYDVDVTGGTDADGDGIDDEFAPRDSDGDGVSDHLDADSDNDGIPDGDEILLVELSGADSDGDGIDDAIDIDVTGGTDANGDGIDDATVNLQDFDGDGLADWRDPDSDNDGVDDGDEDGDFNNDGINDRFQSDPGVDSGLNGGGSFGLAGLFALLLLGASRRRIVTRRYVSGLLAAILLSGSSASAAGTMPEINQQTAEAATCIASDWRAGCWSVGVGAVSSTLRPDDTRSGWKLVDDADQGFRLAVNYRFSERWFAEFVYVDLGGAKLVNNNPAINGRAQLDYSVPAMFAGYLMLDPASTFNMYAKAGVAALQTDADDARVSRDQLYGTQVAVGAGVQWRFTQNWRLNLDAEYYDEDARAAGVSVMFDF